MEKNKDKIVTKHNSLIEATYKIELNELKIIGICLSKINPENEDSTLSIIEITAEEFANQCNIEKITAYDSLKRATNNLYNRSIIKIDERWVEKFRWVDWVKYYNYEGKVLVKFSHALLPYIKKLKERFTSYPIEHITKMKSVHTIRLYEMLMQFKHTGTLNIEIEELKKRLCIENEYKEFKILNIHVIKKAINEINKKTELQINYKKIKEGRFTKKIEFTFDKKEPKAKKTTNTKTKNKIIHISKHIQKPEGFQGFAPSANKASPLLEEKLKTNKTSNKPKSLKLKDILKEKTQGLTNEQQ